ncbi:CU044_2847 family protein [Virgisporangium ochraceum]|uniref:Trypsin-co-occurring domain-containing protein n=1 Tax=Virgisporangium ochraceum TaxID=65505 RepID=A0A8J4ECH2_9ACTN|nr:CU044_2847 family protein [Virgisporangium ochraceum]GIJ70495.1 hypothetical protein Voc01_054120 [Virgisporangium ochraceum]
MTEVVRYTVDDGSVVQFEVDPPAGFDRASTDRVLGRIRSAVDPTLVAAREVLEQAKTLVPDEVEVKFGIKVSGKANWLIAKAATEGNFEVTLRWQPGTGRPDSETPPT